MRKTLGCFDYIFYRSYRFFQKADRQDMPSVKAVMVLSIIQSLALFNAIVIGESSTYLAFPEEYFESTSLQVCSFWS